MTNRNVISSIVGNQLPDFVRIDHPTFVAFLEAYFEWLEDTHPEYVRSPFDIPTANDIDTTLDLFVEMFKTQYLRSFPEKLAIDQDTNRPVDERKLIKNIKAFYTNKGTEKSYEFLFRILYDTAVEFYYPKVDILRCSDGKWIKQRSLRTSITKGDRLYQTVSKRILQIDPDTQLATASARVANVVSYLIGPFEIAEIFVTNVNGTFESRRPFYFTNAEDALEEELNVHTIVSRVSFGATSGLNYKVGDTVTFTSATGDVGQGARGRVTSVDPNGSVKEIAIDNFGVNYTTAPSVTIVSASGTGFSGSADLGALCEYQGYYANNDGRLSTNKVLQDNRYFQNFSYVLKTELTVRRYRDAIRQLIHPAGLGFFGLVSIKRTLDGTLDSANEIIRYEIPLIGHYAPYTFMTYDNLAEWFRNPNSGITMGYDPTVHDTQIQCSNPAEIPYGFTALTGNPISSGVVPAVAINPLYDATSLSPRRNPFYIVYQHPNRRITTPVYVEIPYALRDDFTGTGSGTGWVEWLESVTANRETWYDSYVGTGATAVRIAQIQYNSLSEFRKIRIGSFLAMPIGEHWDSTQDDGIYTNYDDSPNF